MNWQDRLRQAARRKRFTVGDRDAAGWWSTCAVGEHKGEYKPVLAPLPHSSQSAKVAPDDSELRQLGNDFDFAVMADDVATARRVYRAIQHYFGTAKEDGHAALDTTTSSGKGT